MADIEVTINSERDSYLDLTYTKGDRKVHVFERSNSRSKSIFRTSGRDYVVYSAKAKVYVYIDTPMKAQIFALELLDTNVCWDGAPCIWIYECWFETLQEQ